MVIPFIFLPHFLEESSKNATIFVFPEDINAFDNWKPRIRYTMEKV